MVELSIEAAMPHVLFRLGRQAFALPLARIKDVARGVALSPVPHAPDMVRGLSVMRGQLATAIDLRARFGLPQHHHPERTTALAIDHDGERYALLVDKVEDVLSLPASQPTASAQDPLWEGVIAGIIHRDDDTVVVLDAAAVIDKAVI